MKDLDLERALELADAADKSDALHRIGTYNERSQHRTLKFIIEANKDLHEIPIGPYIADVCREGHIYEIQTAGFASLKEKLAFFLKDHYVTVVYPASVIKNIIWLDPDTGEYTLGRRFSKKSSLYKLLCELIHIHQFLNDPKLDIMVFENEVYEYRLLDGRGKDKKIKATKSDTVPKKIISVFNFSCAHDILKILPFEAEHEYTRSDIQKALGLKGRNLANAIKVLILLDLLQKNRVEKKKIYYKLRAFE